MSLEKASADPLSPAEPNSEPLVYTASKYLAVYTVQYHI
jgi:hypothetical protein